MIFLIILILTTISIAGSAAFFSVYGLAYTFSGTFWSVVIMGVSLEAGKLVAASYLYRYWTKTHLILKSYLMLGIAALMLMTSIGIFGYLSAGYQSDVLSLKQVDTQVATLQEEKDRQLRRKKEIDTQITQIPTDNVRAKERLIKQFRGEQEQVTARVNEIDQQLLQLKQQQIKTEAHVGPIVYIAKAMGLDTDGATKYLIFLIIFAFDPMAIALTLAVNIMIKLREEKERLSLPPETQQPVLLEEDKPVAKSSKEEMIQSQLIEQELEDDLPPVVSFPEDTDFLTDEQMDIVRKIKVPENLKQVSPPLPFETPLENKEPTTEAPPSIIEQAPEPVKEEQTDPLAKLIADNLLQRLTTEEDRLVQDMLSTKTHSTDYTGIHHNPITAHHTLTLSEKLAEIRKYYYTLINKSYRTELENNHLERASTILRKHKML